MTHEAQVVEDIRALIVSLPQEQQDRVFSILERFKQLSSTFGETEFTLALSLIGAKMSAKLVEEN